MSLPPPGATAGQVVRSFLAAWNANNLDLVVDHLHPQVHYHNMPMPPVDGREAVRQYLHGVGRFDWIDWKLLALAEDGPRVLTERVDDFSVNGVVISLPIMGIFEVEDGLIRAWRDYFDLGTYLRQLPAKGE